MEKKLENSDYIIGFKIMMPLSNNTSFEEVKAIGLGGFIKLPTEILYLNNKESLPLNKLVSWDEKSLIGVFMFDRPYHEMELPKEFINSEGIIMGKSNCELIYKNKSNH